MKRKHFKFSVGQYVHYCLGDTVVFSGIINRIDPDPKNKPYVVHLKDGTDQFAHEKFLKLDNEYLKKQFADKAINRLLSKMNLWDVAIMKAAMNGTEINFSDLKSQQADNPEMMSRMIGEECAKILSLIKTKFK